MKTAIAIWMSSMLALIAAEPVSVVRVAGDYRVTITVSESTPRTIASISIQHGKEHFTLPASMFDDLKDLRIGPGFKASEFSFEVKKSKALINVSTGPGHAADDHMWILSLPLKDASRNTRNSRVTGYVKTRVATPLTKTIKPNKPAQTDGDKASK
jgi:hypothetical protein